MAKAAELYKRPAEAGEMRAQQQLADFYYEGKGVGQDYRQAAQW